MSQQTTFQNRKQFGRLFFFCFCFFCLFFLRVIILRMHKCLYGLNRIGTNRRCSMLSNCWEIQNEGNLKRFHSLLLFFFANHSKFRCEWCVVCYYEILCQNIVFENRNCSLTFNALNDAQLTHTLEIYLLITKKIFFSVFPTLNNLLRSKQCSHTKT